MIELPKNVNLKSNSPLDLHSINELEDSLQVKLPREFRELLVLTDGFSLGGGLLIYGSDIIVERNSVWEVRKYVPEFLAIGDTGGGDVLLMRHGTSSDDTLYFVGSGAMSPDFMEEIADSLEDWINSGCVVPD